MFKKPNVEYGSFDGKTLASLEAYVVSFETTAKLLGWDEDPKLVKGYFLLGCPPNVRTVVLNKYTNLNAVSNTDIKNFLAKEYAGGLEKQDRYLQVRDCIKLPGQTISEYVTRKEHLIDMWNSDCTDSDKIDLIIDGLWPETLLQSALMERRSFTGDAAFSKLLDWLNRADKASERASLLVGAPEKAKGSETEVIANLNQAQLQCTRCGKYRHTADECKAVKCTVCKQLHLLDCCPQKRKNN